MPRRYTYGPFQSRRLGLSLGVDVLRKHKICTFNCVYCELGITNNIVSPEYRFSAPPSHEFRKELKNILNFFPNLNNISFGYNGEPTLNENLLDYLRIASEVRETLTWTNNQPNLTLFTNSSTLYFDEIRERVKQFEVVLAKLDVGTNEDFERANRPNKKSPRIETIIDSLVKLKQEMPKNHDLVIQCLLYNSYRDDFVPNNNPANLLNLAHALERIKPNYVQIYSIARIPAEYFVYSIDEKRKKEIVTFIEDIIQDIGVKINFY